MTTAVSCAIGFPPSLPGECTFGGVTGWERSSGQSVQIVDAASPAAFGWDASNDGSQIVLGHLRPDLSYFVQLASDLYVRDTESGTETLIDDAPGILNFAKSSATGRYVLSSTLDQFGLSRLTLWDRGH